VPERVRLAWLAMLKAYVRTARTHRAAAGFHARLGFPDLAERAFERVAEERRGYDAALARHPEWAADAPAWPETPGPDDARVSTRRLPPVLGGELRSWSRHR